MRNQGLLQRPRIGSEVYSRILNWEDRGTCVLFGDGAGAAVLSEVGDGRGVLGSWMMSDGSGSDVIEIPAGGVRTPSTRRIR